MSTENKYAIIGAGPCGLAMVRCLQKKNIPFQCFEYADDVGGIWNQDNPMSTMYDSAHLISSKTMTQYDEYPFDEAIADFPHQKVLKQYFQGYSDKFDLKKNIRFNSEVTKVDRHEDGSWTVEYKDRKSGEAFSEKYKGVIIASGLFNKGNENVPKWDGVESFPGQILHSSEYRKASTFQDKKVLIVGCGNSAADIAIDAVHYGTSVDMSVRRGYYFVPKYIFGKPMDTVNGAVKKILPTFIKKKVDKKILKWFAGDPVRFGFPKPEYDIFESHPVVNSYLLQHVGHGDIDIVGDIDRFEGSKVHFKNGETKEYDVVLLATGYHLKYDFIDPKLINWKDNCPDLYLNIFNPNIKDIFVLGMIEATGIGWQGRFEQAELVAEYIDASINKPNSSAFKKMEKERVANNTDLRAGMKYIKLDRMAYYVHKEHYMNLVKQRIDSF
jgi:thioredoxin reductase